MIRRLGPGDAEPLARAVAEVLLATGPAPRSEHLEQVLGDDRTYVYLALFAGDPVGYLSAYRFPAVDQETFLVYLYDVTVREDRRGQGIAAALIDTMRRQAVADGVTEIWVGTSTDNVAARRTFESTGARRASETYAEYIYDLAE